MNRRRFFIGLSAALTMGGAALAQPAEDMILAQLRQQGFKKITVGRTLLGRTRFVATGNGQRREIILNPVTGEILRDFWQDEVGNKAPRIVDSSGSRDAGDGREDDTSPDEGNEAEDDDDQDSDDQDDDKSSSDREDREDSRDESDKEDDGGDDDESDDDSED
ncbi:PepSY domain-containing protein [Celeribacter baekdonensis]|jgi:hypothetical protein|uniref:PepSY domain-containing protein n=1 Tax=Celeribacter baekdonensis B30 TaxID=1208323 RepID=K2JL19_9RHOB|nr:PepSY domain-containing protein [Celeribacter baekdonensis]EKE71209.1 hypothetical protein B30_10610 [Celeribacter baekdonensis B30]|tara:strand:+ start:18140 stop:18628 length:489 start_codon:yes stop_codon:yes gene_type:complete